VSVDESHNAVALIVHESSSPTLECSWFRHCRIVGTIAISSKGMVIAATVHRALSSDVGGVTQLMMVTIGKEQPRGGPCSGKRIKAKASSHERALDTRSDVIRKGDEAVEYVTIVVGVAASVCH
jgi:hypothetical protein